MCRQVKNQDSSALRVDAWERTLSDWLRRADEANHEAAVEAKRNHTHHVHSVLGGNSILSDKEITMPEDDLASQARPPHLNFDKYLIAQELFAGINLGPSS